MTLDRTKIRVPNGVLFISDPQGGKMPEPVRGAMFLATPSCIGFGCKIDCEGETEIVMGPARGFGRHDAPAFQGTLATPNRAVVVSTTDKRAVLKTSVSTASTHLAIWVNNPTEPDKVMIGLE